VSHWNGANIEDTTEMKKALNTVPTDPTKAGIFVWNCPLCKTITEHTWIKNMTTKKPRTMKILKPNLEAESMTATQSTAK